MNNVNLVKNNQVKTKYYSMTTKQGLKVYIVDNDKIKSKKNKINIIVNYGGKDREYIDR